MRNIALLLTVVIAAGGVMWPVSAARVTAQDGGKAKAPRVMSQSEYRELRQKREEEAVRMKAALKKVRERVAELRAQNRKKKSTLSRVTLSFTSNDWRRGIEGVATDKASGVTLYFESRLEGEALSSRLWDYASGMEIEYTEATRELVTDPATGAQSYEPAPVLRFNGVDYVELNGPGAETMKQIANSPQGKLLRNLALYLPEYIPGKALEAERRGLEVPYQAIQSLYASPAVDEYGGGDLKAARQFAVKQRAAVKQRDTVKDESLAKEGEPLVAQPVDCERFQCSFVDNDDYQLSDDGGYAVKSLSPRLALSHNYAPPSMRAGLEFQENNVSAPTRDEKVEILKSSFRRTRKPARARTPRFRNDGSQVGDCFGRCGGGCGNWTHQWVGEPNVVLDYTYCESPNPHDFMPDCSTMCCSTEKRVTTYSGIAVHTAHGKVTVGSKAHDSCVRAFGGPAWLLSLPGMPCFAAAVLAADCAIPGVGEEHTWSYVGPHSEGYDYYTGNCCVAIGPVS